VLLQPRGGGSRQLETGQSTADECCRGYESCDHSEMSKPGGDAAERAVAARERAVELEQRLHRLQAGDPVTTADVSRAEHAADRQQQSSAVAHRHAAEMHGEAARHHVQTADVLDAAGHHEQAAEHRRGARADEEAAISDEASARADELH
jgi:uncharacterized protein YraI